MKRNQPAMTKDTHPMPKLPESIPFETAFIVVFGGEIERRGGDLAEVAQCFCPEDDPDLNDYDPDQIRVDLSEAIAESAAMLGFTFPAGPVLAQLYDMALDSFGPLRDYIDATTDRT